LAQDAARYALEAPSRPADEPPLLEALATPAPGGWVFAAGGTPGRSPGGLDDSLDKVREH